MAKKKENNVEQVIERTAEESMASQEVTIKKMIPFSESVAFINSVVAGCFIGDDGSYSPEARHITTYANLVKRYTDMDLPDDTDEIYRVIRETGIIHTIMEHIDREQYDEIEYAINEKIRYLNAVHSNEFLASMQKLYGQLQQMVNVVSGLFDDVTQEDLANALKNLSESGVTKEDVVKTVLDTRKITEKENAD